MNKRNCEKCGVKMKYRVVHGNKTFQNIYTGSPVDQHIWECPTQQCTKKVVIKMKDILEPRLFHY